MYKGPMGKDKGVESIEGGRWGWVGQGRVMWGGGDGDACNLTITIKEERKSEFRD